MREAPYPPGTRVKYLEHPDTYGRVVEHGPSFYYGLDELPDGCMFVALEKEVTGADGVMAPAGAVFVGSPQVWGKVDED